MKAKQFAATILLCASALIATSAQANVIAGFSAFSSTFSGAQSYAFNSDDPMQGQGMPFFIGNVLQNSAISVPIGTGVSWFGTEGELSTTFGNAGTKSFGQNGDWNPALGTLAPWKSEDGSYPLVEQYISIDGPFGGEDGDEASSMSIVFDTPVRGVGIFLNFNWPANASTGGEPILEARGYTGSSGFTTLYAINNNDPDFEFDFDTFLTDNPLTEDVSTTDPDLLPNQGFYLGFVSDAANISEFRLTGANLAAARLYVIPAEVPEPQGLALFAIALAALGFSMKLRGTRPLGRHG